MAQTAKTAKKSGASARPAAAQVQETAKIENILALDDQTLDTLFSWLHTVDDISIGGHQNKLPRWVYVVAVLWIIF